MVWGGTHAQVPSLFLQPSENLFLRIFEDSREILENSRNSRMRTRAKYYQESFEGNSQKFSKIENEGNIFESFGNRNCYPFLELDV